jgi:hypothetical protein
MSNYENVMKGMRDPSSIYTNNETTDVWEGPNPEVLYSEEMQHSVNSSDMFHDCVKNYSAMKKPKKAKPHS